ncbi:DUF6614 family protein [Parvularcula sp. IMCC14364]|uniref:DUF6614 family protein n=1 Tax=Parvularcula sp. IMCC14364 TaxID=3067902 RepID=UPI0027427778|nr:DUF6614 family protein [Parvularcula sp. IMCC14364]
MNLYHCMIELKSADRSLAFAAATEAWLGHLENEQLILGWRLFRRKFGLASGEHTDFILEIELEGMASLENTFAALSGIGEEHTRRYEQMHSMIESVQTGLYRPYPDPEQRERIALV